MIHLDLPETELIYDASGQVIDARPADNSYPHTIIEMFMVEANEAVAGLLDRFRVPFLRRIHPAPDAQSAKNLGRFIKLFRMKVPRVLYRRAIQDLLESVKGTPLSYAINTYVLRSLPKAEYSPLNIGHYALASTHYCHFTSPIRRYADLLLHRALQAYLTGQVDRARRAYAVSDLVEIGRHLSQTERAAEDAEREVKTILTCSLLHKRIGQELDGVVTSMTGHGAFVFLPDYGVEGLVRTEALGPDHWQYDEQVQCLVGRHSGAVLRMAQPLRVRIVDVYPAAGRIDLAPAAALPVLDASAGPARPGPREKDLSPIRTQAGLTGLGPRAQEPQSAQARHVRVSGPCPPVYGSADPMGRATTNKVKWVVLKVRQCRPLPACARWTSVMPSWLSISVKGLYQ